MAVFSTNYNGRTVDVLAFDRAQPTGDVQLQQTLAQSGQGGKIVTGIMKLAQRFLLELLTQQGSMLYNPTRGTTFMTDARAGLLYTQLDVQGSFARALQQIAVNLISDESATDPLDERYASATIDSIAVVPGKAYIYVSVTSRAGTSVQIVTPIQASLIAPR